MPSAIDGFPQEVVNDVIDRIHRYPRFDENRQDSAVELLRGPEDVMNAALQKYNTEVEILDFKTGKHRVSCDCPDRQHRGLYCKHIIALFAYQYILHETEARAYQNAKHTPTSGENVPDDPDDSLKDLFYTRPEDY